MEKTHTQNVFTLYLLANKLNKITQVEKYGKFHILYGWRKFSHKSLLYYFECFFQAPIVY